MSVIWGGRQETSITTAMAPNMFKRGDRIQLSGFVNGQNNGLFVIRRSQGTQYIMDPADMWDYAVHYATKFYNWAQWKFWGVVNYLEDAWSRLRK